MAHAQSRFGDPKQTLFLLDISSFIFRAYYAIRPLTTKKGEPVNAVFGVATMLARIAEEARPEYLVVAYDSKEPTFREEMYSEYKANRAAPPEELVPQFERIDQLVEAFEIRSFRQPGVEADDLIGSLARLWCEQSPEHRVVIISSDKDLMQLVNDRVIVWDTMTQKLYASQEVEEKMGVRPDQVRDYLGLVGDSSDNIPGVDGIGPKGAADLLRTYDNLEGVLEAAKNGKVSGKKGATLVEQAETARLSAQLATVKCDIPLKVSRDDFKYHFHVSAKARALLAELEFHKLIERWSADEKAGIVEPVNSQGAPVSKAPVQPLEGGLLPDQVVKTAGKKVEGVFHTVSTEEQFEALLEKLKKAPEFGFDVETTSLNPRVAELVGISVCADEYEAYYIPISHRGTTVPQLPKERVLEGLRPLLTDPRHKKIGQNLKYDWQVMAEQGIEIDGIGADTMVASYLLEPEGRHGLDLLASKYLDYSMLSYEQVCGKGKDQITFDLVPVDLATRYAAEDAWIALRLWHHLKKELERERLMDVFSQVDLPLVTVLARMEREGVCIDTEWLAGLSREFGVELRRIEERVAAFTRGPVNLNSPKQLAVLLFEELKLPPQGKTKTGYSTDASVLEALAPLHEVPQLLLEYREIAKLKGTYVDPLPQLRDPKTGKIHTSYHQTVAATGRLSSSDPNLQNIPVRSERGRKIRGAFVPCPGNVLISADYSQIELRLLAHMSADPELVGAFQRDEDVHRHTASEIFEVSTARVTEEQRAIAKAINFGLMYGKTAFGLAQELHIGRKEASEIIHRYFERYSAVKKFLDGLIAHAKEQGYVTTLMGRKRKLGDIHSRNPAQRAIAERMAMNTPIQGTAADLIKLAMIDLDETLFEGGYKARMILQVHDEILIDCPKSEADDVQKLLARVMESAGQEKGSPLRLSVPLKVNSAVGKSWFEV